MQSTKALAISEFVLLIIAIIYVIIMGILPHNSTRNIIMTVILVLYLAVQVGVCGYYGFRPDDTTTNDTTTKDTTPKA